MKNIRAPTNQKKCVLQNSTTLANYFPLELAKGPIGNQFGMSLNTEVVVDSHGADGILLVFGA